MADSISGSTPPIPRGSRDFLGSLFVEQGGVRGVFSHKVSDYMASRPGYPAALFDGLRELGVLPEAPAVVADLGAGTGLLTEEFLQRGYRVVAVEPNAGMRAAADARLQRYDGYRGIDGSAEATTLADGSVDLVTAAQAFHWFEVEASRRECLRILRPSGQVALIWNDRLLADPAQAALDEIFAEFGGQTRATLAKHENRESVPQFFGTDRIATIEYPYDHALDRAGFLSLVFSRSYMPLRQSEQGELAVRRAEAVFDEHASSERIVMRYRTVANVARPQAG